MKNTFVFLGLLFSVFSVNADEHSVPSVSGRPLIKGVSISPDGRYLALIKSDNGTQYVAVKDRLQEARLKIAMKLDSNSSAEYKWCAWPKPDRILCNVISTKKNLADAEEAENRFSISGRLRTALLEHVGGSRLVAFDPDGGRLNIFSRISITYWGVVNWLHEDADHILVLLPSDLRINFGGVEPEPFRLNVRNGDIEKPKFKVNHNGIYGFDEKGDLRVIVRNSPRDKEMQLFAKSYGSADWKEVSQEHLHLQDGPHHLFPEAVKAGTDDAYAIGDYRGHEALWRIDLTGSKDVEMIFAREGSDVQAVLGPDRQLLGVSYGADSTVVKYFDASAQQLQDTVDRVIPGHANQLMDFSRDMKVAIVQSQADKDSIMFYVLDMSTQPAHLTPVGTGVK